MALGSHLITVRRLEKYINDVIGKKANLPDTSKTIIGNISRINSNLTNNTCVNLLNPTRQTQTINGVTFTNNGDGTYTVNGTASARTVFSAYTREDGSFIAGKTFRFVGKPVSAPSGLKVEVHGFSGGTPVIYGYSGTTFTVPSNVTMFVLYFIVESGTTVNNSIIKPMLTTDLNAKYDDYVPYTGDSGRLNEDVSNKQDKTDNNLATTSKTVVGAINELNSDLSAKLDVSKLTFTNVQAVNFSEDVNTGDIGMTYIITQNDWVLLTFDMSIGRISLSVTHDAGHTWQSIWIK